MSSVVDSDGESGACAATPTAGGKSLLGINANTAAAFDEFSAARLEKWELQSVARQLLPKERIGGCLRYRHFGADGIGVWHSVAHSSAHYSGLQTCGSVWVCPVCASKIAERRREELATAFASCRVMGGQVVMATYTTAHSRGNALSSALGGFLASYRSMTGNRPYKRWAVRCGLVGASKALEVTVGANGWHVHAHVALFLPSEVDPAVLADELYEAWSAAARRNGLTMTRRRGLTLTTGQEKLSAYLAKWGHQPTRRLWDIQDELTRAHTKKGRTGDGGTKGMTPFDLLRWIAETGESQPVALFRQYATEFKGRRQLVWSLGLRELLGLDNEQTDEEIAGEVRQDATLLALLSPAEWRVVRQADQRGQLLEVARSGDMAAVRTFVDNLYLVDNQRGAS